MLKNLHIENLILIESASILFHSGLNVLTGETGSGKSAIMEALSLILGGRADSTIIRKGYEKGFVEAIFDISKIPSIHSLLEASNVDHEPSEDLVIRREVSISGKNRSLINYQLVQLPLLRNISKFLIDIVAQHDNQQLFHTDQHRHILDIFGTHLDKVQGVRSEWERLNSLKKQLQDITTNEAQRLRNIEICNRELKEIEEANLKEGEEELLFEEYSLLTNAEERASKSNEILSLLSSEKHSILTSLNRQKTLFENLAKIDPSLEETFETFLNAFLELQEVSYTLRNYQSKIEHNPEKVFQVNDRLTLITKLKKKYGNNIQEIKKYEVSQKIELERLENADLQIENLQGLIKDSRQMLDLLCQELTQKRKHAAIQFENTMTEQLRTLNMPKAQFQLRIESQQRSSYGDDLVEFYLAPNVGEHSISIKDSASGGELARVLLAIQTLLAGKGQMPCLIFDEIDANIGGETASVVGEKLCELGKKHQIFCITHFPQVASMAHHHFQISKSEKEGRTITVVKALGDNERQDELKRMLGGERRGKNS